MGGCGGPFLTPASTPDPSTSLRMTAFSPRDRHAFALLEAVVVEELLFRDAELVDELCKRSPEFEALWRDNNVHVHGEGGKRLRHPILGPIMMEYSAFGVDGRPDLGMIVYNPATRSDADRIRSLVTSQPAQP